MTRTLCRMFAGTFFRRSAWKPAQPRRAVWVEVYLRRAFTVSSYPSPPYVLSYALLYEDDWLLCVDGWDGWWEEEEGYWEWWWEEEEEEEWEEWEEGCCCATVCWQIALCAAQCAFWQSCEQYWVVIYHHTQVRLVSCPWRCAEGVDRNWDRRRYRKEGGEGRVEWTKKSMEGGERRVEQRKETHASPAQPEPRDRRVLDRAALVTQSVSPLAHLSLLSRFP